MIEDKRRDFVLAYIMPATMRDNKGNNFIANISLSTTNKPFIPLSRIFITDKCNTG